MRQVRSVPILVALLLAVPGCQLPRSDAQRVRVNSGDLVGRVEDRVRIFRGIPYASPPVGELRWAPPRPVPHWTGDRSADRFGPVCPQPDSDGLETARVRSGWGFTIFTEVAMAPDAREDCLTLNVWAPLQAERAPVMVFIHGTVGAGSLPYYDGRAFARDGIVLVTINYRLLTLGNFVHPALTAAAEASEPLGRYGELDQMAALAWVRDNIAGFGGDPGNVTLFGHSGGGAATLNLLATPAAEGLFHRAIVQSGNGWWSPRSLAESERMGSLLAAEAGVPSGTADQLRALGPDALPWSGTFYVVDGRVWREGTTEAFAAGRVADVPLMIGWTSFDGSSLRFPPEAVLEITSQPVLDAYAEEGLTDDDLVYSIYTDSHVGAPARWIAAQTATGAPSYLYHFSYVLSWFRGEVRGAEHGHEVPFVFDSFERLIPFWLMTRFVVKEEDRAVIRVIRKCWVAFARSGVPECDPAPRWPRYTRQDDRLMDFGATPEVRRNFRKRQLDAQESAMGDVLSAQRRSFEELLDGSSDR